MPWISHTNGGSCTDISWGCHDRVIDFSFPTILSFPSEPEMSTLNEASEIQEQDVSLAILLLSFRT